MSTQVPQQTRCSKCNREIGYTEVAYFELDKQTDAYQIVCENCTTIHGRTYNEGMPSSFEELQRPQIKKKARK